MSSCYTRTMQPPLVAKLVDFDYRAVKDVPLPFGTRQRPDVILDGQRVFTYYARTMPVGTVETDPMYREVPSVFVLPPGHRMSEVLGRPTAEDVAAGCDCEQPYEVNGLAKVSNGCPVHNLYPESDAAAPPPQPTR